MIRTFLGAALGGLAVVAVAAVMLVFCVPRASAAMACRGTLVLASWYGKETCNGRPAGHGKGKCETASGVARTLDLSDAVARKLGTKAAGVARVCMERVTH